jgi:putative membrane protein
MKAENFFSREEKDRIKKTTQKVETRTMGEVAVMIVDRSDPYLEAEIGGGVLLGSLLSLSVTLLFFHSSLWTYIPLSLVLFFPFRWIIAGTPGLKRIFILPLKKEESVRKRALLAFYEKGLYRTRLNTGVLFFISLLEKKVWVLADKGIYEKIQQQTLNRIADKVSQGIRLGRACETLCRAIEEMGEGLAEHFPLIEGDIDELPNDVLTE